MLVFYLKSKVFPPYCCKSPHTLDETGPPVQWGTSDSHLQGHLLPAFYWISSVLHWPIKYMQTHILGLLCNVSDVFVLVTVYEMTATVMTFQSIKFIPHRPRSHRDLLLCEVAFQIAM